MCVRTSRQESEQQLSFAIGCCVGYCSHVHCAIPVLCCCLAAFEAPAATAPVGYMAAQEFAADF
jgi:hypothetical protein